MFYYLTFALIQDIENDAAKYMMNEAKRFITDESRLFELGIHLGMKPYTIQQIRTDYPHNIILAAYQLAFRYYYDSLGTKEEKLEVFHKVLVEMGNVNAARFESNNNR